MMVDAVEPLAQRKKQRQDSGKGSALTAAPARTRWDDECPSTSRWRLSRMRLMRRLLRMSSPCCRSMLPCLLLTLLPPP